MESEGTDDFLAAEAGSKALINDFPRLFKGQAPKAGIWLPDGWVALVRKLLIDLEAMLDDEQASRFRIGQIKSKFGRLRCYWSLEEGARRHVLRPHPGNSPASPSMRLRSQPVHPSALFQAIQARVDRAETDSGSTCEQCGAIDASTNDTGYLMTLCAACRARR